MTDNDIPGRMARIRNIFEDALKVATAQPDNDILLPYLNTRDEQFRSIAYEAASMARALTDLQSGVVLQKWPRFMHRSTIHSVQVHIGLGWAGGQQQVPFEVITKDIPPLYVYRVLDGYGYYDGTFRHRSSIRDKALPVGITGNDLRGYDQGVGRSLWYSSKGNLHQLITLVEGFDDTRRADLWRGIGIAVAYVGSYDEAFLKALYQYAGGYQFQLATGAAFLAYSRQEAGTQNNDSDMACQMWCHMSAGEACSLVHQTQPPHPASGASYLDWVAAIESALRTKV